MKNIHLKIAVFQNSGQDGCHDSWFSLLQLRDLFYNFIANSLK